MVSDISANSLLDISLFDPPFSIPAIEISLNLAWREKKKRDRAVGSQVQRLSKYSGGREGLGLGGG